MANFYKNFATEEDLKNAIGRLSYECNSPTAHFVRVNQEIGECLTSQKGNIVTFSFWTEDGKVEVSFNLSE
ncbi:MAG TPA: hypothetical protein VK153_03100 [Candidatus Paceibacterota bacterium]|nr:hypothetical protein [Candidatus Paceibacterota bacterium]